MDTAKKMYTVKQFVKEGQWPSLGALKSIIFDAKNNKNNFGSAFKRIGRRVLIDPEEFWACVERAQKTVSYVKD